jgi:hypothetical protein
MYDEFPIINALQIMSLDISIFTHYYTLNKYFIDYNLI